MGKISINYILWFVLILNSCSNNNPSEIVDENKIIKIKVQGNIDNSLQIDSIFSNITAIPLETNDACLITDISKTIFYKDRIYIQSERSRLFVFDTLGNYLFTIGRKGRGPGEYNVLRDFDIDKYGRIFILDFLKILEYSADGSLIKNYPFHFTPKDKLIINPIQFSISNDDNFFIWGGSFSIESNPNNSLTIMYKMSQSGQIMNKYFPLNYKLASETNQFKRFKDNILIDPIFGSNIIYSINKDDKVEAKYEIDFGKKNLDKEIPSNFETLSEFKENIDLGYYHTVSGFCETDEWIYFRFLNDHHFYNVYYSKILQKSFISKPYPRVSGRIAPWIINGFFDDKFISFIEPMILNQDVEHIDSSKVSNHEKKIFKKIIKKIEPTNNPVLFICSMKQY